MEPAIMAIVALLTSEAANSASSTLSKSISNTLKSIRQKSIDESVQNGNSSLVLEDDLKNSPQKTIEAISEAVHEEANRNPSFALEVQEELRNLATEIRSENPQLAEKVEEKIDQLRQEIARERSAIDTKIEDLSQRIKEIQVDVDNGDYVGRDPYILSANPNLVANVQHNHYYHYSDTSKSSGDNISSSVSSEESNDFSDNSSNSKHSTFSTIHNISYSERLLDQIESIRGKTTQYFTAKTGMDTLNKMRQPRQLGELYVQEASFTLPFLFGRASLKMTRSGEKSKREKESIDKKTDVEEKNANDYLNQIRDIEYNLGRDPIKDSRLLRELDNIVGELNNKISVLNNSFIFALYPASSSQELVENMASKIGYLRSCTILSKGCAAGQNLKKRA